MARFNHVCDARCNGDELSGQQREVEIESGEHWDDLERQRAAGKVRIYSLKRGRRPGLLWVATVGDSEPVDAGPAQKELF